MTSCPLCLNRRFHQFHADTRRDFYRCERCHLVFVPPQQRLTAEAEKAEYDLHENGVYDSGYRRFLSRLFVPLTERQPPPARGLDFGCGPGPALASMFREAGYEMALYDIFYANNADVLAMEYDFVTCTEVVEHLFDPGEVLEMLLARLKPGGWLGVMTKLVRDREAFSRWHYKNDMTHVCFFSRDTFLWLAEAYGCKLLFIGDDVILLKTPSKSR